MSYTYAGQYGPEAIVGYTPTGLNAFGSQPVTVYLAGTRTKAALYADRTKAQAGPNPTGTTVDGNLTFFADAGRYDVLINNKTITVQVELDPMEPNPAPFGSGASAASSVSYPNGSGTATIVPRPAIDDARDYGAKFDGITLTDGTISAGTAAFSSTQATFTSADVGKVIIVNGAGAAGATLVTTISAFTDSHHVTLTATATTGVGPKLFTYGTDDTAAYTSWVTARPNGGTLRVPEGISVLNGAQVAGTASAIAYSGQVVFPARALTASRAQYEIIGVRPAPLMQWGPQNGDNEPLYTSGSILLSTATSGAVFDAIPGFFFTASDLGAWGLSNMHMEYRDLTVRTLNNPAVRAINGAHVNSYSVDGCSADVHAASADIVQPTTTGLASVGIFAPPMNNAAYVSIKRSQAIGYYNGMFHAEHATLDNVAIQLCMVGIALGSGYHLANWNRVLICLCPTSVKGPSALHLMVTGSLDLEDQTTGWYAVVNNIDDLNGRIRGNINWLRTLSGVGESFTIVVNGAANVLLTQVYAGVNNGPALIDRWSFGNAGSGSSSSPFVGDLAGRSLTTIMGTFTANVGNIKETGVNPGDSYVANDPGVYDYTVRALVTLSATRSNAGIVVKALNASNYLAITLHKTSTTDEIVVQKKAGTFTTLLTLTAMGLVLGATYQLECRYVNGKLTITLDGQRKSTLRLSSADAAAMGGYRMCGIYSYQDANALNDAGDSFWEDLSIWKA